MSDITVITTFFAGAMTDIPCHPNADSSGAMTRYVTDVCHALSYFVITLQRETRSRHPHNASVEL